MALVGGGPFSPRITLWQDDAFYYQVTILIYPMLDLLVESLNHTFLVRMVVTDSRKPLFINQIQLV